MRALVTPEQTCAYLSMLAAEQRLKVSLHSHFQPLDWFVENKVTLNDATTIMGNNTTLMWQHSFQIFKKLGVKFNDLYL